MADRLIIVDGYNVIHRSAALRPGPERTLRQAREKLVNLLSWAVGSGDAQFVVVFDGAEGVSAEARQGRVEVRFSRPPKTADHLIRELVEERMRRIERITVVTGDLEVARHARAMGADVSLTDLFLASMMGPASPENPEKPVSLSKKEIEEWAEIFRTGRVSDELGPQEEEDDGADDEQEEEN
jgi:predicted RNA-binding protein with PIN domain